MEKDLASDFFLDGSTAVRVRHLRRGDLSALEWEGEYTHFRRVYAFAYERARRGRAVLWVAEADEGQGSGQLLGQLFVLLHSEANEELADGRNSAFIHSFRVRPERRGRGLGSQLLYIAEQDLMERGFRRVYLNVARENWRAVKLYERKGYQRIGKDPGIWSYVDHRGRQRHVHEPSWRMHKDLLSLD